MRTYKIKDSNKFWSYGWDEKHLQYFTKEELAEIMRKIYKTVPRYFHSFANWDSIYLEVEAKDKYGKDLRNVSFEDILSLAEENPFIYGDKNNIFDIDDTNHKMTEYLNNKGEQL